MGRNGGRCGAKAQAAPPAQAAPRTAEAPYRRRTCRPPRSRRQRHGSSRGLSWAELSSASLYYASLAGLSNLGRFWHLDHPASLDVIDIAVDGDGARDQWVQPNTPHIAGDTLGLMSNRQPINEFRLGGLVSSES